MFELICGELCVCQVFGFSTAFNPVPAMMSMCFVQYSLFHALGPAVRLELDSYWVNGSIPLMEPCCVSPGEGRCLFFSQV